MKKSKSKVKKIKKIKKIINKPESEDVLKVNVDNVGETDVTEPMVKVDVQ